MDDANNIKKYSAADIEKYLQGKLSPREMRDMEIASLDDPFLADALEGYKNTGTDISADMTELQTRIAARSSGAKVIAMRTSRRKYAWLRIAALLLLFVGAGLLAKQFLFNKHNDEAGIAQAKVQNSPVPVKTDSQAAGLTMNPDKIKMNAESKTVPGKNGPEKKKGEVTRTRPTQVLDDKTNPLSLSTNTQQAPVPVEKNDDSRKQITERSADETTLEKSSKTPIQNNSVARNVQMKAKDSDGDGVTDQFDKDSTKNSYGLANRGTNKFYSNNSAGYSNNFKTNLFRGRITDAQNRGLPFANVTNLRDNNAGTYTDVNGYFNLTYPDTLLNVHVKSVGFEQNDAQLKSTLANNHVVMNDDRSVTQIVIPNSKPGDAAGKPMNKIKVEEPEPADGWGNYDTYIANNIEEPLEIKNKEIPSGQVEVSFDINKDGEPVNIKVERSLCDNCDKEAIRLVKEGPKWKHKRSGRQKATILVNFNSSSR